MPVDVWGFDLERQTTARRFRSMRRKLSAVRGGVFAAVVLLFVLGGSARLRDVVLDLAGPGWIAPVLFLAVLFALFALLELPFGYVAGYQWEKAAGMSSQSLAGWMKDLAKSWGLGLVATIATGAGLLWLLATFPTTWWVIAWGLGLGVSAVLGFVAPVLLVPLFYRFRPLEDAALRSRFESLAARAKVPILGVFELRASAKTRRSNAAVMGFGRTRRVVVTDTLLQGFSPEEVETVLAHELAHQKYRDPIRGFLSGSAVSLVVLALVGWVYSATLLSAGIRTLGDMAGLPFLAALFALLAWPLHPLELYASRTREARADRFALDLTRDSANFISAMVKLHDRNLGVANLGRWETWLFYSHPSGRDRVEMARALRPSNA